MRLPRTLSHLRRDSPFSRWFAGSRIVDAAGDPLIVFHGTDAVFQEFAYTDDIGFHFGSLAAAETRLRQMSDEPGAFGEGANVRAAVLSIRNPLRVHDEFCWSPVSVARVLCDAGMLTKAELDTAIIVDRPFVAARMATAGYDGFVYENETEKGGDSWIALWSEQVRPWWAWTHGNQVSCLAPVD